MLQHPIWAYPKDRELPARSSFQMLAIGSAMSSDSDMGFGHGIVARLFPIEHWQVSQQVCVALGAKVCHS